MIGRSTRIYSSSLAIILMAIASWLNSYVESPENADFSELQAISNQLSMLEPETMNNSGEDSLLMAWWYPGEPACNAVNEAREFEFDVLKPEYFAIRSGGVLDFMTEAKYGCNGYSEARAEEVQTLSKQQFVMVSASDANDMKSFLEQDAIDGRHTNRLVSFVLENNFTGVELDFEDYGGWTPEIYSQYKSFVTNLGKALRAEEKKLIIDLPPVRNVVEEQWYVFRLAEIENLPVDYILIMGYDYQYDHGVGEPVAPLDWLAEVVKFTKARIQDDNKIVIGLPSYGYIGDKQTNRVRILTKEQANREVLYEKALRDGESKELMAESATQVLVYQDMYSINAKIAVVKENGIHKISLWHLGGNPLPEAVK